MTIQCFSKDSSAFTNNDWQMEIEDVAWTSASNSGNPENLSVSPRGKTSSFPDSCLLTLRNRKQLKNDPLDSDEDSLGVSAGGANGVGGTPGSGALRPNSQSAFLGPLLWERTLPCDGGLFQLQYMDLEEFLTENGMGMHSNGPSSATAQIPSPPGYLSCRSAAPASGPVTPLYLPSGAPGPPAGTNGSSDIMVNFDPDPADLALSSVPGQEAFDPRRHRFTEDELKPQPMIKKARKMLVPDDQKDEKYWSRRVKNNEAAKRSRDARRLKENQISVRAAFLERENAALRQEVADMRKELGRCRNIINKYESRHGDL
uniref:D site albumin promoter binding protein a n=1 Tax=Oreochromis niloticus TaxID=8128 RepID=I3JJ45_ORENI